MSDQIIGRIDEMGSRIDELESSIGELMAQVTLARAPCIRGTLSLTRSRAHHLAQAGIEEETVERPAEGGEGVQGDGEGGEQ